MPGALAAIMVVTSMPIRSLATTRLPAKSPDLLDIALGGALELMILAVEALRERRATAAR
jgi:hypothetical protein